LRGRAKQQSAKWLPMLTQNNQHELKVSKRAGCPARASAAFQNRSPGYVRYQT
jgi:hypothetical protein